MSDRSIRSNQFDIRINIVDEEDLKRLLGELQAFYDKGSVQYVHCTSLEIGDKPDLDSFGKEHVHIALILNNFTSKASICKRFLYHRKNGWYCEPRDKKKSFKGWINYHKKARTKIDPTLPLLLERGKLPNVREPRNGDEITPAQKKRHEQWQRRKYLMTTQQWDELDLEFPGFIWTSSGQNMKREIMKQSNDEYTTPLDGDLQNYIIWGPSGTGKSSSIALLYPNCYKKQKGTQYWDGFDKTNPDHQVVWIDEMSKETLECLVGKKDGGFEFLKELADRYPVTVDEKYTKGYKIRPKKIIITMNEHPTTLLPDRAVEINKNALYRKFKILHVSDWLALNGLLCTSSGCRFMEPRELDAILEFDNKEINEEKQFNDAVRNAIAETPTCSSGTNNQRNQGPQAKAKRPLSGVLPSDGRVKKTLRFDDERR